MPRPADSLFRPFDLNGLTLANRVVMAPMTRKHSPGGVPGADVAAYYRRRAAGGTGLIITEGTYVAHPTAGPERAVPHINANADVQEGWRAVTDAVHDAGGLIFCQLWHIGWSKIGPDWDIDPTIPQIGPSGFAVDGTKAGEPMSESLIADVIAAFGESAAAAKAAGFDGIEIHGAHGYLIDQFFWSRTNKRSDGYGGDVVGRSRFATEIVRECRRRTGRGFPISFRYSQWKIADYNARLAETPDELDRLLSALAEAGVDVFHCSTRYYWEPAFDGSALTLAGWTKKLTGKPSVAVGSVGLDIPTTDQSVPANPSDIDRLLEMLERDEFDLVAVGRAELANPDWPNLIRRGAYDELKPFIRAEVDQRLY